MSFGLVYIPVHPHTAARDITLDPDLLRRWRYEEARSLELTDRDRSAIYGGFHLYVLEN